MAKADGSIVIDTKIDSSNLNQATTSIKKQFGEISASAEQTASAIRTGISGAANGASDSFRQESEQITDILEETKEDATKNIDDIADSFENVGDNASDSFAQASEKIKTESEKTKSKVESDSQKTWSSVSADSQHGSKKVQSSVGNIATGFASTFKKLAIMIGSVFAVRQIVRFGAEATRLGSDLQEVQNVVDVTFTTMNEQVNAFAQNAAKTAGLSETMAKRYTGTFGAMAKSFKFTEQEAYTMSTALTQLTGDVASFYNISQDEAYTKLKSVFTGETESLKDLGVVMTQAALDDFALRKGIGMTTREMTEQQKVALRYQFVMEQLAGASGDFQRTQSGWANQTRLLSLQFQQLKATIGQGLINVLTPVLQVINNILAKLQVLAAAFRQLTAALFGDASAGAAGSGVADLGNAYNDAAQGAENLAGGIGAAGAAAKKANKQLLNFDELNTLADTSSGGGGGGASGGGGNFDFGLQGGKLPSVEGTIFDPEKVQKVADIIKKIAEYIPVMVTGLAGLKLGKFISDLVTANKKATTLKEKIELLGKKVAITAGVTLAITGIALETKGIISSIKEGLNKINFAEIIGGGGLIVSGGALIGNALGKAILGASIGGLVAGIPAYFAGLYDAIVNQLNILNASLIGVGSTLSGAAVGAIIGSLGGPIGTGIGALIGLVVGLLTDLTILIVQKWDKISKWLKSSFASVGKFFSEKFGFIAVAAQNCFTFIVDAFSPIYNFFLDLFSSVYKTVSDIFYNIGVVASGCWQIIKKVWEVASGWFNDTVIKPVSQFFSNMWSGFIAGAKSAWEGIKSVFSTFASWFRSIFEDAWRGIINVFSIGGEIFTNIKNGIVSAFKAVVNSLIRGINSVVSLPFKGINKALESIRDINILGLTPFSGLRTINVPQIPYLAKGAVIPPNAPFMAMLGDQKNGTNIEAPLSTIQEALLNALEQFGGSKQEVTINFTGDLAQLARVLKPVIDTENKRIGSSLAIG